MYKRSIKYFFHMYKSTNRILSEKQRKATKRVLWKVFKEEKNKKQKYACESHQNLSEEENDKKRQYHCECQKYIRIPYLV